MSLVLFLLSIFVIIIDMFDLFALKIGRQDIYNLFIIFKFKRACLYLCICYILYIILTKIMCINIEYRVYIFYLTYI